MGHVDRHPVHKIHNLPGTPCFKILIKNAVICEKKIYIYDNKNSLFFSQASEQAGILNPRI